MTHLIPLFPAGLPFWLFVIVAGALALHIAAGGLAILAGYIAIFARKGGRLHRRAGLAFFAAMVLMGVMAAFLSIRIQERGNFAGGILAIYLVATAWMTVRRPPGGTGRFEIGALAAISAIALFFLVSGIQAELIPTHRLDGYPPGPYFAPAVLASLFAWGDWRMLRAGGVTGSARLARHVGRMGFAFFFAAGSFFLGQQQAMPAPLHGSPILLVLGLAPLALTLFWLVRIRVPQRRRAPALTAAE